MYAKLAITEVLKVHQEEKKTCKLRIKQEGVNGHVKMNWLF